MYDEKGDSSSRQILLMRESLVGVACDSEIAHPHAHLLCANCSQLLQGVILVLLQVQVVPRHGLQVAQVVLLGHFQVLFHHVPLHSLEDLLEGISFGVTVEVVEFVAVESKQGLDFVVEVIEVLVLFGVRTGDVFKNVGISHKRSFFCQQRSHFNQRVFDGEEMQSLTNSDKVVRLFFFEIHHIAQ